MANTYELIDEVEGLGYVMVEKVDGIWWASNANWICRADRLDEREDWEAGCWAMVSDGSGPMGQGRTLTPTGPSNSKKSLAPFVNSATEERCLIRPKRFNNRALFYANGYGDALAILINPNTTTELIQVRGDFFSLIAGADWDWEELHAGLTFSQLLDVKKPPAERPVLVHWNGDLLGLAGPCISTTNKRSE